MPRQQQELIAMVAAGEDGSDSASDVIGDDGPVTSTSPSTRIRWAVGTALVGLVLVVIATHTAHTLAIRQLESRPDYNTGDNGNGGSGYNPGDDGNGGSGYNPGDNGNGGSGYNPGSDSSDCNVRLGDMGHNSDLPGGQCWCADPQASRPPYEPQMCSKMCHANGDNQCRNVWIPNGLCFAGEAVVTVQERGSQSMQNLQVGDRVMTQINGEVGYERVLGFLHAIRSDQELELLAVSHTFGELRASESHIVFLADGTEKRVGELIVGDQVMAAKASGTLPSTVTAIRGGTTRQGMYAPLTASGTVIVDGVVASNYAQPLAERTMPHRAAHAALFPARIWHSLGFGVDVVSAPDMTHPVATALKALLWAGADALMPRSA